MWPVSVSEWIAVQTLLRIMREGAIEEATAVEVTLNEFAAMIDFRKREDPAN